MCVRVCLYERGSPPLIRNPCLAAGLVSGIRSVRRSRDSVTIAHFPLKTIIRLIVCLIPASPSSLPQVLLPVSTHTQRLWERIGTLGPWAAV